MREFIVSLRGISPYAPNTKRYENIKWYEKIDRNEKEQVIIPKEKIKECLENLAKYLGTNSKIKLNQVKYAIMILPSPVLKIEEGLINKWEENEKGYNFKTPECVIA